MEMPGLVPDNLLAPPVLINIVKVKPALSVIMEESTESTFDETATFMGADDVKTSGNTIDEADTSSCHVNSSHSSSIIRNETSSLIEAMRSVENLVRSKFDKVNETLISHCRRTQRLLGDIRVRIDAFLRPQKPSIQHDHSASRSSRLPHQRTQYYQRSTLLRATTSRYQRTYLQRNSSQRSPPLGISGQRSAGIHRRSVHPTAFYARDALGLSRNARVNWIFRSTSATRRDLSSL